MKTGPKVTPLSLRLPRLIDVDATGCWLWRGALNNSGYGSVKLSEPRRSEVAHRAVYEALKAPIPQGMQLDHLCRVRHCVNPDHLEPVTRSENILRSKSGVCIRGHAFDEANTYWTRDLKRRCRTCHRDYERERYRRLTAVVKAA